MVASIELSVPSPSLLHTLHIQKASQLPRYYTQLADILSREPLFRDAGLSPKPCKAVILPNSDDARIFDIFNYNALYIFGASGSWPISNRGNWVNANHCLMGHAVILHLYNNSERCPLETLQNSYRQILNYIRHGWVETDMRDHPEIEDTNDFAFFAKTTSLKEEDILIRLIARRISMAAHIRCHNKDVTIGIWNPQQHCEQIFLWVRKSALNDIVEKFGFQFQERSVSSCVIA